MLSSKIWGPKNMTIINPKGCSPMRTFMFFNQHIRIIPKNSSSHVNEFNQNPLFWLNIIDGLSTTLITRPALALSDPLQHSHESTMFIYPIPSLYQRFYMWKTHPCHSCTIFTKSIRFLGLLGPHFSQKLHNKK